MMDFKGFDGSNDIDFETKFNGKCHLCSGISKNSLGTKKERRDFCYYLKGIEPNLCLLKVNNFLCQYFNLKMFNIRL